MLGNFPRQTIKWPERATYNLRRFTAGLWRTSFGRTCLAQHLEMDGWWRGQKHVEIPYPIINIIFTAYIYHIYIHIHLIRSVISIIYIYYLCPSATIRGIIAHPSWLRMGCSPKMLNGTGREYQKSQSALLLGAQDGWKISCQDTLW